MKVGDVDAPEAYLFPPMFSPTGSGQPYQRGEWVDFLPAIEFSARINLDALTTSHTLRDVIVALH